MRPIPPDVYDTVADLACGMTNATCADDAALHNSLYQQLLAFYEDQSRQGTLHPFVVETLADYTEDRPEALRFYREALAISEPDEPRYTILISMAERLIEVGERDQAEACLRDGRAEAEGRNDSDYVAEANRVLRDLVAGANRAESMGLALGFLVCSHQFSGRSACSFGLELWHVNMLKHSKFAIVVAAALLVHCSCRSAQILQLPKDKVLLNISFPEKDRLLARLGFTNRVTSGPVFRDSMGVQRFIPVEPGPPHEHTQTERTQKLVVVTAQGARIEPWHFPANERVTDDAKVAVWQDATQAGRWQVRSGEWLPTNCWVEDVSGDWIAVARSGRAPWVARLDTPNVIAAELPDSPVLIAIYATGQVVHVFTRRGWRNEEGPMRYLLYDFAGSSKPIKELVMPSWARITLDMDPETGLAVINDNNRFWGRSWLFDINTRKRKWISTSDWTLIIVKNEVAEKWIALTKP